MRGPCRPAAIGGSGPGGRCGQPPSEPAEYPEQLTGLDPATAATPSCTELAARASRERNAHPAEPVCCIDPDGGAVFSVSWHPDGRSIAVATRSDHTRVYDISGERPREQVAVKSGTWITWVLAVAFCPDGTRLATGSDDKSARVWSAPGGQKLLEVRHDNGIMAVAFCPDGTRLATGSDDKSARVWDAAGGQKLLEVRHDKKVTAVAFSPDGTRLATGSHDRSARVWDAAGGQQVLEVRHRKKVTAVAFSPDGTRLATGSYDKTVRIWSVAEL
jgi:WD40 repeat protein